MAKANITQYSSTPSSNTDINNINIDENCPASGLNNAIRELMAHLKNVDTGTQALTALSVTGNMTVGGTFTSTGIDDNANALAMTIDSSERVLIGMTTSSSSNDGIQLIQDGRIFSTVDGQLSLILNRKTSDGSIAEFRKDGSTVGSIGSHGGTKLYIGSGAAGLRFTDGGTDLINPYNTSTNADADGTVNLGYDGGRFKDLYLSGGVYLGGTGSANLLDDYEEGFVNLGIYPSASGTITIGTNADRCEYTKVGRKVTISGLLGVASVSSPVGQYISIQNLPFTVANLTDYAGISAGSVMFKDNSDTSSNRVTSIGNYAQEGFTILRAYIDPSTIVAGDDFFISLTYFTT